MWERVRRALLNSLSTTFLRVWKWEKQYFSFPGELLMRMLKMLILPLITSSLMSGLATMDSKACGKMGVITITYYLWTTFMAVTVGIILVVSIHPGAAAQKDNYSVGKVVLSSADALLDLIRSSSLSSPSAGSEDVRRLPAVMFYLLASRSPEALPRLFLVSSRCTLTPVQLLSYRNMFPSNLVEASFQQ
ncbi:PREDICTED: excitatory amino acid transporter 5-like, partial [Apaloderma vittatum]|uniref:excitatory amino acid transporter 5-like n=1 Tax=Apaloderma vittatum TaxID=57397 RepID=UPI00052168CB